MTVYYTVNKRTGSVTDETYGNVVDYDCSLELHRDVCCERETDGVAH